MTEERLLVTVLFADVVGSTALGEALDPEETQRSGKDGLTELERMGDLDQMERVTAESRGSRP